MRRKSGSLWDALKCYLRLRPRTLRDAVRLYLSFPMSVAFRALGSERFESLGYYIPGNSLLTVSLMGIIAQVRPGTNDIAVLASTTEPHTASWFHVADGEVVVDVGAHIGRYSLMAATKASKVIAIEPEPSNFAMLGSNIKLNRFSNIEPLPLALSESQGRVRLHLGRKGNLGSWSTNPELSIDAEQPREGATVEVECDTLDHLLATVGVVKIDWLKIDAEGHESLILKGARDTLARTRHMILEVANGNERECKKLVQQAGLQIISTEKGGGPTSNWLLERL